jgi:hypothetical protein
MSRDGFRDTTNKLPRSNSHDNISLNPISSVIHSKPTSHGAGEKSLGVRDDGTSMSSSSEHVASSPYHNVSSAMAVSVFREKF